MKFVVDIYFHKAPIVKYLILNAIIFDFIYCFDVLRSDKSISSNGLEPRTPFLDKEFVDTYLSLPAEWRFHAGNGECEKYFFAQII